MPVTLEFAVQVIRLRPLNLTVTQMAARLRCTEADIVEALGMLGDKPSGKARDPSTPTPPGSDGDKP